MVIKRRSTCSERKKCNLDESREKKSEATVTKKVNLQIEKEKFVGHNDSKLAFGKLAKKNSERLFNINLLEQKVLQYIIGQDEQVRQIITAIYRSIIFESIKSNILVVGSSGTGKTETIQQIAKNLDIPYTIEDATKYTKEGYYGSDVEAMIYNLIENAGNDIKKAQKGIIVIDEIDKKVSEDKNDVSGVEVLKSLLKIIEGTNIKVPDMDNPFSEDITFSTKNIIIIFSGAFDGLDKIRDKRLNKNQIGFCCDGAKLEKESEKFTKDDLDKYGMPKEFIGRIDTIVEMNNLTKEDLVSILKSSRLSIFSRYKKELKALGVHLQYNKELFEQIAGESLKLNTGARELSNTVNYMYEKILYEVFKNPGLFTKCALELDIVKDNTKYKLS